MTENKARPLAVITGASSGIGYELAKVFSANGFDLIIAAEDDGILDAANTIQSYGSSVLPLQVDLADEQGVEKLWTFVKAQNRPVDSLVLNAGVGISGEFIKIPIEKELNLINLNITSLVRLTKKALPEFVAAGKGRLLFTSSIAAEMPGPYYAVYAASKSFVQSFAEAIRYEVKEKGITVTALQPGATDTNFFARAEMLDTKAGTSKKDSPAKVAQDGFDALMAGQDHVVAGSFMNKVESVIAKVIPETQAAGVHAQQTKPGSGHH